MSPEQLLSRDSETAPQIPKTLKDAYAHHCTVVETPAQLAMIAEVPVEMVTQVLDDPDKLMELEAYRTKLEAQGTLRPTIAARIMDKILSAIDAELDKGVDGFEAAELSKPLSRILENHDRVRLAEREKDPHAGLATFIFNIGTGGISARQTFPETVVIDAEVEDIKTLPDRGAA